MAGDVHREIRLSVLLQYAGLAADWEACPTRCCRRLAAVTHEGVWFFMTRNRVLRLVFSMALIPTGAVFVLLASHDRLGTLISSLGLSLIVAGILNSFREVALLRLESEEAAAEIAKRVQDGMLQILPSASQGIRLVSPVRRGYDGYYRWATTTEPRELFFAGRSVLHRIDADFRNRGMQSVEQVLHRKLQEGSTIRIMFLDPRSALLHRLAEEEGQTEHQMLSDIATSLGICNRLYQAAKGTSFQAPAQLSIRAYDAVPYFSYHKDNEDVIVGFYFVTALGSQSAAFSVLDEETRSFFGGHFTSIFDHSSASAILDVAPQRGRPTFNSALYDEMCIMLSGKLGPDECERLILGTP